LVEGDGGGPPVACRALVLLSRPVGEVNWLVCDGRSGAAGLSAGVSSRARAIALAVSSSLRSGRWLGGLRFEMAGDSRGKRGMPQHCEIGD